MTTRGTGALIAEALKDAALSQRALADRTGISQTTLSRIIAGTRPAKMTEIVAVAEATGTTVARLAGISTVADRLQCAARATNGSAMDLMRERLTYFFELSDYLDDQGIPAEV